MAAQKERSLLLAAALIVGKGRQPERLIAPNPATLAEEWDYLRRDMEPAAFAHDLVDATPKPWAPMAQCGTQ
jgi:hypothetical protein